MSILFIFLSGCISTIQVTGLQSSHSVQTNGEIDYSSFKVGIYGSSWNFHEYDAGTIAKTFDMSQSWWINPSDTGNQYDAKISQVHALNPNYKFLLYRNCMSVYKYWVDEWNYAKSQGWLLKDANGNYVTESNWGFSENYMVDITSQSYQQWLGAKVESWLVQHSSFDGIYADNSLKCSAQDFEEAAGTRPINPSTGTYFTDQQILDGCIGMLNSIIDAIGTSRLLMPNGIWNGAIWSDSYGSQGDNYRYILSRVPRLNCLASEGTFRAYDNQWYSESDWKKSIDFVAWVQDSFLNGHPERCFTAGCSADPLPHDGTTERVMMYGFSSMLLASDYPSPQNTIDFNVAYWNTTQYPTELELAQKLRNLDMVQPLNDYYKIASTSVYARDFLKGKVLVNPSSAGYIISLNGTYTDFYDDSTFTSSILVPAHTGIILLNGAPVPPTIYGMGGGSAKLNVLV
jgi:hypothetical protein